MDVIVRIPEKRVMYLLRAISIKNMDAAMCIRAKAIYKYENITIFLNHSFSPQRMENKKYVENSTRYHI
jgi:hypothetical protein